MSFLLTRRAWLVDLLPIEKFVLLALVDCADDDGRNCFPSQPCLAEKTGYSKRTIVRAIDSLMAKGIVRILRAATNRSSVRYQICLEACVQKGSRCTDLGDFRDVTLTPQEDFRDVTLTPQEDFRDVTLTPQESLGCHSDTSRDVTVTPDPIINQSTKNTEETTNNNIRENTLVSVIVAEAEKAVVVVGVPNLIASFDDDQKMALLSWLWLYNGWFEDDLDYQVRYRRSYKSDPFAGMQQPAAVMVRNARLGVMAPLTVGDREDMMDRLRALEYAPC